LLALGCIGADPQSSSSGQGGTGGTGPGTGGMTTTSGFGGSGGAGGSGSTGGTTASGGGGGGSCDPQMVESDPMNCGACGRPCSTVGVASVSCSLGVCDSTCTADSGVHNLIRPQAPFADDGCESLGQRVFVTNDPFFANFGKGVTAPIGALGADDDCQAAADAQGLGGVWMAWVSDFMTDPATRFTQASVPYLLLNGVPIASDWLDLTDGSIDVPISLTEKGATLPLSEVWTGTTSDGVSSENASQCAGWTDLASDNNADVGRTDSSDGAWTSIFVQQCSRSDVHLYCFEQ